MVGEKKHRGPVAWMARNSVTANLLMVAFILGGIIMGSQVKQEIFPEFDLDFVSVVVPYLGASPEEVEKGILKAVEEEVRSLDDVKNVSSSAREGFGSVFVELMSGANVNKSLQDVKNAVDRITSFPQDIERPIVSLVTNRQQVLSLVVHGQQSEATLRRLAEEVREELLELEDVTLVEFSGARNPEISIEIPQDNLRAYSLTLNQIANQIDASALEVPGGSVKTDGGEILLRTTERRNWAREYADLPIITRNDGTTVRVGDLATVKETFEDNDISANYNGEPAIMINVFRVGDQRPTEISEKVKAYIEQKKAGLPGSVSMSIWNDYSESFDDRISLLVRNAILGLTLVLILLGLFLDIRLAFWVTMGIPISIIGSALFLPTMDVSINMVSLFAIIVTIGIVVDDAIVVGENVFAKRQKGIPYLQAAIEGAQQMAVPVTFAILTNIAAFMPLLFVPGVTGKFFKVIPQVVIFVFLISLIEALFILPAHLSHKSRLDDSGILGWLNKQRRKVSWIFQWLNEKSYQPLLKLSLRWRYVTVAIAIMLLVVVVGMVRSGRIEFTFMPKVESERIGATASLPFGAPVEKTREVQQRLLSVAREIVAENGGESIVRGIFSQIGTFPSRGGPVNLGSSLTGSHITNVQVYLVPIDKREISAEHFVQEWNRRLGEVPGVEMLNFLYNIGPQVGKPIAFTLSHPDPNILETAASELALRLKGYAGVRDIDDGYTGGKGQLDFTMKPSGQSLGLSAANLAMQVRSAFFGAEALRNQRGRDEVRVYVRLPKRERISEYNIEELIIRAPNGTEIPLKEAAEIKRGKSYTEIVRTNGRRVLTVTADVELGIANADKVMASVMESEFPELQNKFPGLTYVLDGEKRDQQDALSSLGIGFILALFAIFAMLAIPFKSYSQPLIIMTSIPFGMVGAIIGHMIMGYELSVISMFGVVALAGVVVNGGLILINESNHNRWSGMDIHASIFKAGTQRFRPIVLTSVTTFIGLAPMIFETSLQARFLIPMAISLGFGILFSTAISLVLVPSLYTILFDVKKLFGIQERQIATDEENIDSGSETAQTTQSNST